MGEAKTINQEHGKGYGIFAAVVLATNVEQDAAMHIFDWHKIDVENDAQTYYSTTIEKNGAKLTLVCAKQDEMGMCAASALSTKMIMHFRPQYLFMFGIAAGLKHEEYDQFYGDVLVADSVWNYSSGKFVEPELAYITFGNVGFLPKPSLLDIDPHVIDLIKDSIRDPSNECVVHLGPIASGSSVVANREIIDKQINTLFNKTTGLDMESYGVVYSAMHAPFPRPYPIIAKSVCDFADGNKNDDFQQFAAYTSCQFCRFLMEKHLPDLNVIGSL